ncbi:dihydrolipoyl dehydrogenase [Salinicoccus albus]|uniref:dihydrolipoyl dehydrogenase n=1 Tax=Salinicoccus albus TaxID=418756 RepID=UPI00037B95A5|nr:dihydrolipoyl dehydrogenase [Salinicoccus albus]
MKTYDLIVIGSGPGGYVSAIRAAQLGKSTAIVEKAKVGGACLNVGCVPSKVLLKHGAMVQEIKKAGSFGIDTGEINIDYARLTERKTDVVQKLTDGVGYLLDKNSVALYEGSADVKDSHTVAVNGENIKADNILLATGSRPFIPPIKGLESSAYETTDTFFELTELPKELVVIGGGVIGSEIASAAAMLGSSVTIIEAAADILLTEEEEVSAALKDHLESQGVHIVTQADIKEVQDGKVLSTDDTFSYDTLLVATGRTPNTEAAANLNLKTGPDDKSIEVDDYYETSEQNIYAIGDLIGRYQLAHAASAEGIAAVDAMTGKGRPKLNQTDIPRCIYTALEAASIGLSEAEAEQAGFNVSVSRSPFSSNSKAAVDGDEGGFIKIINDKQHGELLGAFIVGKNATELIGEVLATQASEGTMHELSDVVQPHPSQSEAIGESAGLFFNQAIHI